MDAQVRSEQDDCGLDSCESLIGLDDEQVMEAIGVQHVHLNGDSPNARGHGPLYVVGCVLDIAACIPNADFV